MKKSIFSVLFCLAISPVHADWYMEFGLEGGGEEMVETNLGDSISAGGGIKIAGGIQNYVNDEETASIRLTLGYLFDSITADNGDADFNAVIFDAMYLFHSNGHVFGVGGTMHMSPEATVDIDGLSRLKADFDDAVGVVFQYGYQVNPGFEIGARFNNLEYEINSSTVDASSFGLFMSNGF